MDRLDQRSDTDSRRPAIEAVSLPGARSIAAAMRRRRIAVWAFPGLIACALLGSMLGRLPEIALLGFVELAALAAFIHSRFRSKFGHSVGLTHGALAGHRPRRQRLLCQGHPEDLTATNVDAVSEATFQPIIVTRVHGLPERAYRRLGVLAALVLPVCAWLGFELWMAISVAAIVWWSPVLLEQTFPVYYRLVPGRMDVMRFCFWASAARTLQSVSLQSAEMTCTLDEGVMEIRPRNRGGPMFINVLGLTDPHTFVRGVFQAALCQAATPALPSGDLFG